MTMTMTMTVSLDDSSVTKDPIQLHPMSAKVNSKKHTSGSYVLTLLLMDMNTIQFLLVDCILRSLAL